uniref:Uncharacterized protein n=1 Tax=Ulva partita TaxID=1605170 RepID=A0A1C9ZPJ1_9CHLO|nr:hypothetical protein [Ulva partita]
MVGVSWIRGSASTVTENADLCGGLQFCDQLENADRCLASTIARTSRLQKLLTCHISSTTFHQSGRSLSDLNRERSSLMSIRCVFLQMRLLNLRKGFICTPSTLRRFLSIQIACGKPFEYTPGCEAPRRSGADIEGFMYSKSRPTSTGTFGSGS